MTDHTEIIETAKLTLEYRESNNVGAMQLAKAVIEMAKEIDGLLNKVDDYGVHEDGCEYLSEDRRFARPSSCTCGLYTPLSQQPTPGEEKG